MKLIQHILFWVFTLAVLTLAFGRSYGSYITAFYFVSMLLPVAVGMSYFFNLYLVPRYLMTARYVRFVVYAIYMLIISLYLEMIVITLSFIVLADYQYSQMNPITSDLFVLTATLYLIVFIASFGRLYRAYNQQQANLNSLRADKEKIEKGYVEIRANRQNQNIELDKVIWIESLSDVVHIHCLDRDEPLVTREKISKLEARLPAHFLRIHRSFVINTYQVTSYNQETVSLNAVELPIGRTYRKEITQKLKNRDLV